MFALGFIPGICLGGVLSASVDPDLLMWLFVIFLVSAGEALLSPNPTSSWQT